MKLLTQLCNLYRLNPPDHRSHIVNHFITLLTLFFCMIFFCVGVYLSRTLCNKTWQVVRINIIFSLSFSLFLIIPFCVSECLLKSENRHSSSRVSCDLVGIRMNFKRNISCTTRCATCVCTTKQTLLERVDVWLYALSMHIYLLYPQK